MVIVEAGGIAHHGACADAATHRALERVFRHRIRVHSLDGVWMALPRMDRAPQ